MLENYLQLLGDFRLMYAGKVIAGLDTPRLRTLVAYLALHRDAPQMRRHLAFLFWPDSSEEQALTNLRKQLLNLRAVLPDFDRVVRIERQTVQWHTTDEYSLDVTAFEENLARAVAATGEQSIRLLRCAIDLYRGDLLPECYDDWIFPKREMLRQRYATGLSWLVQLLEDQRDYTTAIDYAQRLVRHDPLHEPSYCCLMRLYALNGDRASALRIYHTCVTTLYTELGVAPNAETCAAYERLLQQPASVAVQRPHVVNTPLVGRQKEWRTL